MYRSVYLLDKLVSCGRHKPMVLRDEQCRVLLPASEASYRAGSVEPSITLLQLAKSSDVAAHRLDHFAALALCASTLGHTAAYMLQGGTQNDSLPPWDPNSEFVRIWSRLLALEECIVPSDDGVFTHIEKDLRSGGQIDRQRCGHFVFSRMLFHVNNILLNHPFLLWNKLQSIDRTAPTSFLAESFKRCRAHAVAVLTVLEESEAIGYDLEASFLGYCVTVAGSVHCLYLHDAVDAVRTEAAKMVRSALTFLKRFSLIWNHGPRLVCSISNHETNPD